MSATSASAVANWFLDTAASDGRALDQLQLQKLVYYSQAWYLANKGEELFVDNVYAWPHGPVITSLWQQFRESGRAPIRQRAVELELDAGQNYLDAKFVEPKLTDEEKISLCQQVWEKYGKGKFTGLQLSNMTHARDEPWEIVRRFCQQDERPLIPINIMREAFQKKLQAVRPAN